MQILGNEQTGFRTGYSTTDHILTLHRLIELYLNTGKGTYCSFIDYRKAFDYVKRILLWKSILRHNINGKVFRVVFDMYKSAKSCIILTNNFSDIFKCHIGVRQGENLSPLLFALL